jgi:hypothetical protein
LHSVQSCQIDVQQYSQTAQYDDSAFVMQGAQHAPATLVRLREERRRSRLQATVGCGLLAVLGFYAALKVKAPVWLVGWP